MGLFCLGPEFREIYLSFFYHFIQYLKIAIFPKKGNNDNNCINYYSEKILSVLYTSPIGFWLFVGSL